MSSNSGWVWLLSVLGVFVVGCSSSDAGSAKTASPVALTNFCSEWADAACTGIQKCCTTAARKYGDAAACAAAETARCQANDYPALSSAQYVYDPQAAGTLIAILRNSGSACAEPEGSSSLSNLVGPALAPGAACQNTLGPVAANPCLGSFCKPAQDGTTSSCALTPAQGESCPDSICASGLVCRKLPNATAATCELPGAGSSGSGSGASASTCSGQEAICPSGQVCRYTDAAISEFIAGTGDYPSTYQCLPRLPNGATTIDPYTCESGLVRIDPSKLTTTCVGCKSNADCYQPAGSLANSTLDSIDNYSGYCDGGACHDGLNNVAPGAKSAGAVCFDAVECRSQTCDDTPQAYGHCGAPDVDLLFCTTPFTS